MSPDPHTGEDAQHQQERAEEVRAYLVALRGGAPFLSGADARLLARWLDQGVPVATILSALDQVALRRRERRVRSRMTLASARKLIEKAPKPTAPPIPDRDRLAELVQLVQHMPVPDSLQPARTTLAERLRSLTGQPTDAQVRAALDACRAFHDTAWDAAQPEIDTLQQAAEAELAPLRDAVSARVFQDLLTEATRDQLRRRYPLVSAQVVWDTLSAPDHS